MVREIIERHGLFDAAFTLFARPTAPGWRERHRTVEQRIDHSLDDLVDNGWARFSVSGKELAGSSMDDLDHYRDGGNDLLSLCSRLHVADGAVRHLPLMDLATDEFIPNIRLTEAIRSLCGGRQFWLRNYSGAMSRWISCWAPRRACSASASRAGDVSNSLR